MVLDRERDAVLAEHGRELGGIAGVAAADHAGADRERELARAPEVLRADPGRVRRDADPVPAERLLRQQHVLVGRPVRAEMGAPEVDRLEPEPADPREQRVEALAERLERRERLVRGPVAVAPAVHRPAGLARDLVRGHEHDPPGAERTVGHRGASVLGRQAPRPPGSSPLISPATC